MSDPIPVPDPEQLLEGHAERDQWMLYDDESPIHSRKPCGWNGSIDHSASWKDPADWLSLDEALEAAQTRPSYGVGYRFVEADPYIAIDIDGCLREDTDDPKPAEWFQALSLAPFIDAGAHIDISPSEAGLRIIIRDADVPSWWRDVSDDDADHVGIEVINDSFATITGNSLHGHEADGGSMSTEVLEEWLREAWDIFMDEPPETAHRSESASPAPATATTPNAQADVDLSVYDILSSASYPEEERVGHPFHPSGTGSNFKVDDGGETWRCWRHDCTGNAAHLLGLEAGILDCGEWTSGTIDSETWRDVFDYAREKGYDIPAPARAQPDGGAVATTTTTERGAAGSWDEVRMLFDSNESGSTTRGYNTAADLLGEHHSFATIRDTDELYFYDPDRGFYVRKGRSFIDELLEEHIPDCMNTGRRKNIFEKLRARNYVDADEFSPPEGKVCVANGVLDLDTRELEPHSPDYYFTSRLQTPYIEGAEANRWEEFIAESTTTDEARKLEEFIGYCLEMWHHGREKNLFIVGPRQSGKSTFTDTVQALFGDMPTVTHLTPQQIADTRFGAANLKDAALNSVNDINATKIEDTGTLKRAFSGEGMKFERKGQDEEFGEPNAKHLYSANWLPTVVGQDESLFRRVLIVEFPNKVDDDERELDLKDDLKGELPGILSRALDARDRLHEQGGFTNDRSDDGTRRTWDAWLDAHKRFLYTQFRITGDSADTVGKETYYQAYKEYAGRKGYQLKPKQGVTKSLQWVPEISVRDDEYAGLVWDDGDAGDPDGGDVSTTLTQDELVTKVKAWVEAFATPTTPAQREEILEHAERKGEDPERVANVIDNLCDNKTLWKPEDGGIRPS